MTPLDVLRERGWCKGVLEDGAGRVCLVGAANMAFTGHPFREVVYNRDLDAWLTAAAGVAGEQFPERRSEVNPDVVTFNNHPDTTLDDVVLVCEKAALRLDEQVTP